MQIQNPHFHCFHRQDLDGAEAWHAVFALRLISCPSERPGIALDKNWTERRLGEQADLINALFCPSPPRTIALRYLSLPCSDTVASGRIEVALLGKTSAGNSEAALAAGQAFFRDLVALMAGALPDYAWSVEATESEFADLWTPFSWEHTWVAEVRRREDRISLETVRRRPGLGRGSPQTVPPWNEDETVYLVHPFHPRWSTLGRLLRTLLMHPEPLLWQVALVPVWLRESEEAGLTEEIAKCESYLASIQPQPSLMHAQTIYQRRAAAVCQALVDQLVRLQDAPYLLHIAVASPAPLPISLVEAVGVEVTGPVTGEHHGGGYDVVVPTTPQELDWARANVQWLEFTHWGESLAPGRLERLRRLVDAPEAAGAFRFPLAAGEGLPGVEVRVARLRPLPREISELADVSAAEDRLPLGENRYLSIPQPVYLTERDRRRHLYVVGQTGTGKTTLLKQMVLADMEARRGLALIDPHGDLFEELLALVPAERRKDVVILDPADTEYPVGLNMLECADGAERHTVVREMRAIMQRLLEDQYQYHASEFAGPVFYQHMQMNMLLAMSNLEDPGTLLEFYEIFRHERYWRRWLPLKWHDAQLQRWVEKTLPGLDYTKRYSEGQSWGEYLSSKFDDFVFDPKLRFIFGQKGSTLDLSDIMNTGKILLVNLAKGVLTEANARFLGMALLAKLQAAAMKRVNIPVAERRSFYLYVDEFQSLATESFLLLLSEARKFGLGLVLANQFLSQIKDDRIIQAVFGNVGTLIAFRVGHQDAAMLESQFLPYFDRHDLVNLSNWTAVVRTAVAGEVVAPFTLNTVAPGKAPDWDAVPVLRAASQKKYGRHRALVESEIARSLELSEDRGQSGARSA